ncbi:MAG: transposase, partial [Patescibacteria group bacterium]
MPVYFEHTRHSIRLPGYDYASSGAYFVTICAYERECLFGETVNGEMRVDEIGRIVWDCWNQIPEHFPNTITDEFIAMPNHIHGIIRITDAAYGRGTACRAPTVRGAPTVRRAPTTERFGKPVIGSIPTIVRGFKSAVTKRVNEMNPLFGPVWQRNYYERVIRSDVELDAV